MLQFFLYNFKTTNGNNKLVNCNMYFIALNIHTKPPRIVFFRYFKSEAGTTAINQDTQIDTQTQGFVLSSKVNVFT